MGHFVGALGATHCFKDLTLSSTVGAAIPSRGDPPFPSLLTGIPWWRPSFSGIWKCVCPLSSGPGPVGDVGSSASWPLPVLSTVPCRPPPSVGASSWQWVLAGAPGARFLAAAAAAPGRVAELDSSQ